MGHNGLPTKAPRVECQATPHKAMFFTLDKAERRASQLSEERRATMVPYACASCGFYHLTSDAAKSDVVTSVGGVLKTNASDLRDRLRQQPPQPVRIPTLSDETIIDSIALRTEEILAKRTTITTAALSEQLGCARETANRMLKAQGWRSTGKGRAAYWVSPDAVSALPPKQTPSRSVRVSKKETPEQKVARLQRELEDAKAQVYSELRAELAQIKAREEEIIQLLLAEEPPASAGD